MADLQEYLSNKHLLDDVLRGIDALVSLPEVYLKFRQLMDEPNTTLAEWVEVVGYDPNIAALVLKFANSPLLYGFSGKVVHIDDAIRLLGTNKLHDIVLAASVMSLDYPNEIMPLKTFWRCSLFSGILARLLGQFLRIADSEGLFVIGLLHQIGCLVIYSKYPGQAKQAIIRAREANQPIHIAEQAILGFHYGQVGAKLMAQWRLPSDFQVITYFQPIPGEAPILQLKTTLVHIVHAYAHQYIAGSDMVADDVIISEELQMMGFHTDRVKTALEQAKEFAIDIEKLVFG